MKPSQYYEVINESIIRCVVCERKCILKSNDVGLCRNYMNLNGSLVHIGYGVISAIESRPIEIKPLYHYWPNSTSLTFSGYGCNFYCPWCQNYHLSFSSPPKDVPRVSPEDLVREALLNRDEGLCASFNEPTTLFDYLLDVFSLGSREGLYGSIVTNGYLTARALKALVDVGVDGYSIDIKGCPGSRGRALGSVEHEVIFRNAKYLINLGAHVEMVFLVVTGFNDDWECFKWVIDKHLNYLGQEIPLHINKYYPANYWHKPEPPLNKLVEFRDYALSQGISYVYIGNVGSTEFESTKCPRCGKTLIVRSWFRVRYYGLTPDGRCPRCGLKIYLRGGYVDKGKGRGRTINLKPST